MRFIILVMFLPAFSQNITNTRFYEGISLWNQDCVGQDCTDFNYDANPKISILDLVQVADAHYAYISSLPAPIFDLNLESALKTELGLTIEEEITQAMIDATTTLDLSNNHLETVEGLGVFHNIQYLDLS
ncbi:MAG: hypothetical protein CSA81_02635 [Acidobacteria bacterium]|nr:MAG: hypothetical protein CSA81_02635 [Acidobacteriota bacterium]